MLECLTEYNIRASDSETNVRMPDKIFTTLEHLTQRLIRMSDRIRH
jgi:S-ribosylhomocysteine lyase LuxS involved in autoinducer biosynthesis